MFVQMYEDSPFSTAVQISEIKIKDSELMSVANKETFIYQPFGAIDVPTRIMVSMNLQLAKTTMIQPRKKNDLPVFILKYSLTHTHTHPGAPVILFYMLYIFMCNVFVFPVVSTSRLSKSRSIMFEKPTGLIGLADAGTLVAATQSALTKLEPIVDMDGADRFAVLVQLLKVAKKDDILSAFQQIMSGSGNEDTEVPEYVDKIIKNNIQKFKSSL